MKKIGYRDLQIQIEIDFQKNIEKSIKSIIDGIDIKQKFSRSRLTLPGKAIDVDQHYAVKYIIERINKNFGLELNIRIFLYQSTLFNISCFPVNSDNKNEIQIFVSQHFFNNLNEDEQVAIIGHEISHFLFDHFKYSLMDLMNYQNKDGENGSLKANIIYWSKAREITADIMGLVANDFNFKAYSTAIIKHFTGLNESSNSNFNVSPLVNIALKQYDSLANDPLFNDVSSTHPVMPLRVKIINTITQSTLIKNFGKEVSIKTLNNYKKEYNETINKILKGIYPEIFADDLGWYGILIPMAIAVILADDKIDGHEIKIIENICSRNQQNKVEKYRKLLFGKGGKINFIKIKEELINESISFAKRENYNKHTLVPMIRKLLLVADIDGYIDKRELICIHEFAKHFNFTREEIVILLQTQYQVNF
jgi:Zn-dependent protease with chaperone function